MNCPQAEDKKKKENSPSAVFFFFSSHPHLPVRNVDVALSILSLQ